MHEDVHHKGEAPAATDRIQRMKAVRIVATAQLAHAQEQQKRYYDKKHDPQAFRKGDCVLLSTKHLRMKLPSRKLSLKYEVGLFTVSKLIGS